MKLDEIIKACGEDVLWHTVEENLVNIASGGRGNTAITFGTTGMTATQYMTKDPKRRIGVVVWLPRDKVDEIQGAEGLLP